MTAIWTPELTRRRECLLTGFARGSGETASYAETFDYTGLHRWSLARRDVFWSRVWEFCGVIGERGARALVDGGKMPGARWFPDARLNFAENLLRPRPDDEVAIAFQGERQSRRTLSFAQIRTEVAALAAHLRALGVAPGDRVAAYTHNGPEAVIGMLAAASIGAVWASCSADFGARGVLERFGQIEPKVLIVSDGYYYKGQKIERLDNAREIAGELPSLKETLIIPYIDAAGPLEGFASARLWPRAIQSHEGARLTFEALPFDHPLYIMFSSGTTGVPKCIVHGAGGTLLQHLKEHQLQCDVRPGDRVFYATTTGWMMWNWLVSALASRATILLYDGFPMYKNGAVLFDLASLITSTGSPLSPESFDYVYRDVKANVQLASISGGTDIVSCFVCGNPWSPVHRGEIQGAGLGMAVEVWDADGRRLFGEQGELVCTRAFPAMPIGFWNDPGGEKYHAAYFSQFPGIWRHGDYATQTANGGFVIHGRSDATLNPQGVRIGTADIYRIVETFLEVEEALAVAQGWEGGERIVLFVKLRTNHRLHDALIDRIKHKLKAEASPRHVPAMIVEAPELPHTRSGKLVELAVREVINGRPVKNREALANPDSLAFFSNLPAVTKPAASATPQS
jgi:acetoacetyl-CoA synthetase